MISMTASSSLAPVDVSSSMICMKCAPWKVVLTSLDDCWGSASGPADLMPAGVMDVTYILVAHTGILYSLYVQPCIESHGYLNMNLFQARRLE